MPRDPWWQDRIPRNGETPAQAADRLWATPGYAGSHEDAVISVADAMAMHRAMTRPMTPEEIEAQRQSWLRGMTQRCEHGVLDFEQCPECRGRDREARDG